MKNSDQISFSHRIFSLHNLNHFYVCLLIPFKLFMNLKTKELRIRYYIINEDLVLELGSADSEWFQRVRGSRSKR